MPTTEDPYQLPQHVPIMAGAVGLTSAIATLVPTAYSSCQKLYSTFDGVRNAPKHMVTISNDLEDFYLVLVTFQELLDDEEFSAGIVQHAQSGNLCNVLKNCPLVFNEFNTIISEYHVHKRRQVLLPPESRTTWLPTYQS